MTVAPARPRPDLGTLLRYRTIDLVTVATLSVAFGVVFWGWNQLYAVITAGLAIGFPPAGGLLNGPWLLAGVVGGLVVRRPGAALGTELGAAVVSGLLGSQWGLSVVVSGLVQGLGAELVLAVLLWRRFGVVPAVLAGALSGVIGGFYEGFAYYSDWNPLWRLSYMGFFAVSGAVVAGVGGWLLVRALARTGALDSFGAGREHHAARTV
ncbi:ECF transporter S component [Solicola sp. PLA-1-18]|uniref:ECF transporter S component n=1 Tax=Solicola sp. PLA-1-18 TaxID=3380532 RepID=UPI003B7A4B06